MPAYAVEFTTEVERDFELIFDFLEKSYRGFGESAEEAVVHAATRVEAIRATATRLGIAPYRGTRHPEMMPNLRHVTIDQAIYWFLVDEDALIVRVLAIFFWRPGPRPPNARTAPATAMTTKRLFGSSSGGADGSAVHSLNVNLLGDRESVVHFHPEIPHGAFDFRMPEQKLDRTKIAGLLVVLLCHKFSSNAVLGARRKQQGHRGRLLASATAMMILRVGIEFGVWRSGRTGGAPRTVGLVRFGGACREGASDVC